MMHGQKNIKLNFRLLKNISQNVRICLNKIKKYLFEEKFRNDVHSLENNTINTFLQQKQCIVRLVLRINN